VRQQGGGVQHPTARRAPSPYTLYGGRDSNAISITSVANDQESFRREFFGQNNAPMSQAPRQQHPEQTQQRAIVKERVAAWEGRKFNETDNAWAPETFDIGEDDIGHSGNRGDWRQTEGERHETCQREKPSSKAASSTGSGASRSLDGRKKERDLAIARLELKKAESQELEAELHVAELDAAVGLSRRSRNSSQASSARSNNASEASGSAGEARQENNDLSGDHSKKLYEGRKTWRSPPSMTHSVRRSQRYRITYGTEYT
jgi:hypothetical protein